MTREPLKKLRSELIGPSGQVLHKVYPTGLYIGGQCQSCGFPLYYHGGGPATIPQLEGASVMPLSSDTTLEPEIFMTCSCEGGPELLPEAIYYPPSYDLYQERMAVITLFRMLHSALGQLSHIYEQLHEVVDVEWTEGNESCPLDR